MSWGADALQVGGARKGIKEDEVGIRGSPASGHHQTHDLNPNMQGAWARRESWCREEQDTDCPQNPSIKIPSTEEQWWMAIKSPSRTNQRESQNLWWGLSIGKTWKRQWMTADHGQRQFHGECWEAQQSTIVVTKDGAGQDWFLPFNQLQAIGEKGEVVVQYSKYPNIKLVCRAGAGAMCLDWMI